MYFSLVDRVLEVSSDAAATLKVVSLAEEYLQDHFPSFPVLPGVLMLEAMVQTCREVAKARGLEEPLVLGQVRALKYNRFVPPGSAIRTEVSLVKAVAEDHLTFKCRVLLLDLGQAPVSGLALASGLETGEPAGEQAKTEQSEGDSANPAPVVAASGRITLRPIRVGASCQG